MKTKKIIAITLSMLMLLCFFAGCTQKGGTNNENGTTDSTPTDNGNPVISEAISVFVSVANGKLEAAYKEVSVKDMDSDGKLTINDTLICAHEQYFPQGKEGFATQETEYGLSVTRLWGVEGYSIGYNLNDSTAMGLTDEVKKDDYVCAFVYTDSTAFSDAYSYFDTKTVSEKQNTEFTLSLNSAGFDDAFNPVVAPVAGAKITLDGEETDFITDKEGKVTLTLSEGEHIISAVSHDMIIVPPVCIADITK